MKELNIANGNLSDTKNGIAGEGKFTSLNTEAQKMDESNSYSPSKEKHVTIQAEDIEIVPVKKLKETKEKNKDVKVGIFHLFHYSTSLERFLLILGIVLSVCAGAMLPLNLFIYGRVANAFIQHTVYKQIIESGAWNSTNISSTIFQGGYTWEELQEFKDVYSIATSHGVYFVLVGVGAFVFCFGHVFLWNFVQERQMNRIHKLFFKSCLRQEIGWFDVNESGELSSRFSGDMHMIADGLGDKISTSLQWIMTSIICYVLAFILGWKLALSTFGFTPFVIIMGIFITKWVRNLSVEETKAYSKAGAVAEEVLSSIRTVMAYNGQEKEIQRYKSHLGHANTTATKKGLAVGLGMSFLWILIYSAFAICFWYGVKLIRDGEPAFQAGNTLTIFIGCIVGSMAVGQALPVIEIIGTARGAAQRIFSIIETASKIDPFSACGEKPEKVVGNVVFQDVHFSYPARPEVKVMKGLSLEVQPGQTVALVGPSGCGKSTVIQLLQRFYDTDQGQVLLDGKDIKDLNVSWLRRQIGVVNQEPVLFGTTIEENIRFGKETATQDDIIKAAKNANAHEFISQLPQGYKTMVGERGAQLSGGQKQRIAIARALVRDPKILLLDEATSALDNESESIVQKALEKAQKGRTTIVVAHRLSTIRNADVIYCIEAGQEIEVGNHQELMNLQGMYSALVNLQSHKSTEDEEVELVRQLSKQEGQSNEMGISDIQDVVLEELEHEMLDVEEGEQSALLQQIRSRTSSVSKSQRLKTQMSVMSQHSVGNQEEENHHFLSPEEDEDEEKIKNVPLIKVLRFNSPEWYLILIACVLSVLVGVVQPSFAIIFGEFLSVFTDEPEEQKSMSVRLVGYLMAIAVGNSIVRLIMSVSFTRSGSKLTQRFRYRTFEAIVWQDIPYFDDAKNRVGALTARLSSDAALIQGAAGNRVGSVLEAVSTIACSFVIAFIFSWKLAFVMAAFMPLVIIAGAVQAKMVHGFSRSDKEANIEAGKIATETIDNIRTVVSLHKEDIFYKKYCESMDCLLRLGKKKAAVLSGAYSFSQAVMFFSYAAAFSYGGYLIQYENLPFENVFKVFGAIIFGGMSLGRNSAYAPDYNKGKLAASRLFSIIESKPKIDSKTTEGKVIDKFQGSVALDHVKFSYPARPNVEILKGLSIQASAGETLALVGTSGCGKSTTIQLIERFYDPAEGTVLMDNQDIRTFNLQSYRSHIGIVSQEPVLFDLTILENIAYGDNTRMVPMDEIIAAARKANIHNFIESLPQGYHTNIGEKGTQLSGGQKQRVAIARALVRNPRILLLDEATSALDSESERVVQDALDKAREGRTCFVIAHRLSTIRNADRIAIIHKGEVVELGSHSELIAKKGIYYKLLQHNVQKT